MLLPSRNALWLLPRAAMSETLAAATATPATIAASPLCRRSASLGKARAARRRWALPSSCSGRYVLGRLFDRSSGGALCWIEATLRGRVEAAGVIRGWPTRICARWRVAAVAQARRAGGGSGCSSAWICARWCVAALVEAARAALEARLAVEQGLRAREDGASRAMRGHAGAGAAR